LNACTHRLASIRNKNEHINYEAGAVADHSCTLLPHVLRQ
jgi:hypothetical protein